MGSSTKLNVQTKRKRNLARGNASLINTRRFAAPIRRDANTISKNSNQKKSDSQSSVKIKAKTKSTSAIGPPPLESMNSKPLKTTAKRTMSKNSLPKKTSSNVKKDSTTKPQSKKTLPNSKPSQNKPKTLRKFSSPSSSSVSDARKEKVKKRLSSIFD